jgi:hypothetical protein
MGVDKIAKENYYLIFLMLFALKASSGAYFEWK